MKQANRKDMVVQKMSERIDKVWVSGWVKNQRCCASSIKRTTQLRNRMTVTSDNPAAAINAPGKLPSPGDFQPPAAGPYPAYR